MQNSNKGTILLVALLALGAAVYVFFPSLSRAPVSEMNSPATTTVTQKNILPEESLSVGKILSLNEQDIATNQKSKITQSGVYTIVSTKTIEDATTKTHNKLFEACTTAEKMLVCRFLVKNTAGDIVEIKAPDLNVLYNATDTSSEVGGLIAKITAEDILNTTDEVKAIFSGVRISTTTLPYRYLGTHSVYGDTKEYTDVTGVNAEVIKNGKPDEQILASSLNGVGYDTFDNGAARDEDSYTYSMVEYTFGKYTQGVLRSVELREDFATTTQKRETTLLTYDNDDREHAKILLHEITDGTKSVIEGKSDTTHLDKEVVFTIGKKIYTYNFETNALEK